MSAELIPGVLASGAVNGGEAAITAYLFSFDHGMALAAIGGCCFFLGASAALPWSTRIFYGLGSCIIGYMFGIMMLNLLSYAGAAAFLACVASALASWIFGSLKRWADGGPRPEWVDWFVTLAKGFLPDFLKRGKRDE
ncbi:MAG: hypothetical protein K0R45_2261 [Pseudomonas sp.]|jgi:hypothetical protein|nr:hypothetical protein [Pseudomonas sp.]